MLRYIAAALVALTASNAAAANCGPRDVLAEVLRDQYGESLTSEGLVTVRGQPAVLQVWSSSKSGTFSVVIVHASGVACMMASGTDWIALEPLALQGAPI